jgi:hypothetical protein
MLAEFSNAVANAVSSDGARVLGMMEGPGALDFVWDQEHGTRSLKDFLQNENGLNLNGWQLNPGAVMDVSGNIIAGYGTDPQGQTEIWIAIIPEPTTMLLLGLGAVVIGRRRKR